MTLEIAVAGQAAHDVAITRSRGGAVVRIDGVAVSVTTTPDGRAATVEMDDHRETVYTVVDRDRVFVHAFGRSWTLTVTDPVEASLQADGGADTAIAPMPGVVVSVPVGAGDEVADGQVVAVIESMKMQTEIRAPRAGVVERVVVPVGGNFESGAALVVLVQQAVDDQAGD